MKKRFFIAISAIVALSTFTEAQVSNAKNRALNAHVSVTGDADLSTFFQANNLIDGIKGVEGSGEWAIKSRMAFWGERDYPTIKLSWHKVQTIGKLVFYDRPSLNLHGC